MGSVPHACSAHPPPPCWHSVGSLPARGIWLGLKGSDKIKAPGCPRGWGALNPDNGWHPNTRGWQRWPWWVTITGSGCPRARNHGGEERKFSNPMESVEEKYRARWCPVWWDTRDGSSLVGSTTGGSARECGVQGGMEMAEDHRPKGPAVREEVLKSRGGWERDADPRAGWSTQPDPQEPPRPALPCWAVPQRGSARAFGVRDEGRRQREAPGAGFRGRDGD